MDSESRIDSRECPNGHGQMVFTPDGRARFCEVCGYRHRIQRKRSTPAEIAALQLLTPGPSDDSLRFRAYVRDLLVRGIAAAKEGDKDEAHHYLEWVLRKDATSEVRTEAWLWLSELYEDPADRRECLTQVLALQPSNALARRGLAILDGRLASDEIVDPDELSTKAPTETADAQAEQFRCPRCSGRMNYTPDERRLICEFCGYEQRLSGEDCEKRRVNEFGIGAMEQDFIAALATARGHSQPVSTRTLQCQGCAIEFALAPETLSLTCPYCDSVYVTETAETRELLSPQALIPFCTTVDDAKSSLRTWFRKHRIEHPRTTPIIGVYLPAWTFDISGELRWNGLEHNGNDWVPVSGEYYLLRDDLLIAASNKLSKKLARILKDFDLESLVEYDARYLADWPAERYQIALSDASLLARKTVLDDRKRSPAKMVGGRSVHNLRISSRGLIIDSFKLILLPVWMVHYKSEDRMHDVVINGHSGKVRGERDANAVQRLFSWFRGE